VEVSVIRRYSLRACFVRTYTCLYIHTYSSIFLGKQSEKALKGKALYHPHLANPTFAKMIPALVLRPISAILFLICSVSAEIDFSNWSPAAAGDVRSPCPGLNALANHNILPHSGKGITVPMLISAFKSGLNVGSDVSVSLGTAAIALVAPAHSTSFDLDQLNKHNVIEHDASLSRSDYNVSPDHDNHDFNQTIFDQVLRVYEGMTETSIEVAAKAKIARLKFEMGEDSQIFYGPEQYTLSYGESALYLSTMGDPITGVGCFKFVKVLFEEERLPYNEGWRPTADETTLASLGAISTKLIAASGEPVPLGVNVTTSLFQI